MALMERVTTLIRANLNDLIDRAEDPEKLLKQVILDMQNQLIQVKTQVAIALADQHLLIKKQQDQESKEAEWCRKADLALNKNDENLARAALERLIGCRQSALNFKQQVEDQGVQVENLKAALRKLEQKLAEAQARFDVLMAQHRRARVLNKAGDARLASEDGAREVTFDRLQHKILKAEALGQAKAELTGDSISDQFARLEKDEQIEQMLTELKALRSAGVTAVALTGRRPT